VELPGLADDVPVEAGQVIRIVTTGGGGWGDPLEREPERVRLDAVRGLVSRDAAERDYGVVLAGEGEDLVIDEGATISRREELQGERPPLAMFDRGVPADPPPGAA
jgi:N-methylhydantoinase B